jgi:hypothetical protein
MAKGKHSTALFEVIHSGKKPDRVAQSLRTPKWWFKSSHQSRVTPPPPSPAEEEPQRDEADREEVAEEAPATRLRPSRGERSSGIRFGFNRNNQEFTFKLRYTTALVTGFGVCVLVGLSYVVGRHLGGGPKVASAEQASVKELLQQPAQPDVTKVTPRARVSPTQTPAQRSSTPATSPDRGSPALANNSVAPRSNVTSSFVPASADTTMPRKVGLNYLVLSTYPVDRKQIAEAARDYFTKNGIPCSLEKTEWAPGKWITLVGTAGFKRVSTDDFKSYLQHAATLAKNYKTSNFDRPEPTSQTVYKWVGAETAVN